MSLPEATPTIAPRVLLLGGSGLLGQAMVTALSAKGWTCFAPAHAELDVTWPQHLEKLRIKDFGQFDWVVNCTAYTQVDAAESNTMQAMKLNGVAPGMLGVVCAQNGWRLLHVSTDFVFDGESAVPYTEDRATNPINTYGKSKLLGEQNVLKEAPDSVVVRTSWLFGDTGKCFPRSILEAMRRGQELKVVDDQFGKPTYATDLAGSLVELISLKPASGIYHLAGPDPATWYDFARRVVDTYLIQEGNLSSVQVSRVSSLERPMEARRPKFSVLDCSKTEAAGVPKMRPLSEALDQFVKRFRTEV